MKLINITCPQCGANVESDFERMIAFCPYCGSQLFIEDDSYMKYKSDKEKTLQEKEKTLQEKTKIEVERERTKQEKERTEQVRMETEQRKKENESIIFRLFKGCLAVIAIILGIIIFLISVIVGGIKDLLGIDMIMPQYVSSQTYISSPYIPGTK